jgi:hypothetical protein
MIVLLVIALDRLRATDAPGPNVHQPVPVVTVATNEKIRFREGRRGNSGFLFFKQLASRAWSSCAKSISVSCGSRAAAV